MSNFESVVLPTASVAEAIPLMNSGPGNRSIAGIVVVADAQRRVVGVLSDGDLRRGLSQGKGGATQVIELANRTPVLVRASMSKREMRQEVVRQARSRNRPYQSFTKIVVVDDEGRFVDVVWSSEIFTDDVTDKTIAVYGLGPVGLTLAAVLASNELRVTGIDTNESVVSSLRKNRPTFFERGLESLLQSIADTNPIRFVTSPEGEKIDVHIVSVGTPVDERQEPDLSQIKAVCRVIEKNLKTGDLVVFRSTLPVGTTRQVILPILSANGKQPGRDFLLAFAPERTVEGNALHELRVLPQIVGGYDEASYEAATKVFRRITHSIVAVESLEAAEMVKLVNNTFRDLVFAFANEVALVCDDLNVNAFDLLQAANEGYPRNPIPMPSPGVGGLCLSKDPHLFCAPIAPVKRKPVLGTASRSINSIGHHVVMAKLEQFAKRSGRSVESLDILIVGLAFKGHPATSDIRYSTAADLIRMLPRKDRIAVKDFVVAPEDIAALGVRPVDDIYDGFKQADAVLVMNNHVDNNRFTLYRALNSMKKPGLFFDGWNMFEPSEIEHVEGLTYATLGYMSRSPAG
jgi:UDP-N-acetyl-D-mannosaminuronic acid dehydrogenase